MTAFRLQNSETNDLTVFKNYVDVYIHCENNKIIESHKIILAQHSTFFHRFFLSRKDMKEADMFFPTIKQSVAQKAIDIIYGKTTTVEEKDRQRVCAFLRMLEVEFQFLTSPENEILEEENTDMNRTFDNPMRIPAAGPSIPPPPPPAPSGSSPLHPNEDEEVSVEMETREAENWRDLMMSGDWTVTTATDEQVAEIDHTWRRLPNRNRNEYTCNHCKETCLSITIAKNHFIKLHLNTQALVKTLADIDKRRKKLSEDFAQLVDIQKQNKNANKFLIQHESEMMLDNIEKLKTEVKENVKKTILPQHAEKKKALESNLRKLESDVKEFIRVVELMKE